MKATAPGPQTAILRTSSRITGKSTLTTRPVMEVAADLLVVPVFGKDLNCQVVRAFDRALHDLLLEEALRADFHGAQEESFLYQTHGLLPARHLLLLGSGPISERATWYQLAEAASRTARQVRARSVAIGLPSDLRTDDLAALAEGMTLAGYQFTQHRSGRDHETPPSLTYCTATAGAAQRHALARSKITAAAACYARDLVNTPAGHLTPRALAREARRLSGLGVDVKVHGRGAIERLGMGGLLGVARGSAETPSFIELSYRPAVRPRARVALVGKGVTFDSGGLSLKNPDSMRTQKRDMAGGAVVLAAMSALPALKPAVEVRGYIPAAENMPGGRALKPGDVVRAINGTTIEVLNTDAEGRLLLADGLAYAAKGKPDVIIDFATLTAAVNGALGSRYAAIMGTDAQLIADCISAGALADERLWELPLVSEYRRDIDSQVADIKNTGEGQAGTIIGGLFLREFVAGIAWAHIDFSSTAVSSGYPCHPQGASGFGVRTVLHYLMRR